MVVGSHSSPIACLPHASVFNAGTGPRRNPVISRFLKHLGEYGTGVSLGLQMRRGTGTPTTVDDRRAPFAKCLQGLYG